LLVQRQCRRSQSLTTAARSLAFRQSRRQRWGDGQAARLDDRHKDWNVDGADLTNKLGSQPLHVQLLPRRQTPRQLVLSAALLVNSDALARKHTPHHGTWPPPAENSSSVAPSDLAWLTAPAHTRAGAAQYLGARRATPARIRAGAPSAVSILSLLTATPSNVAIASPWLAVARRSRRPCQRPSSRSRSSTARLRLSSSGGRRGSFLWSQQPPPPPPQQQQASRNRTCSSAAAAAAAAGTSLTAAEQHKD
jgi:hypothetical protein